MKVGDKVRLINFNDPWIREDKLNTLDIYEILETKRNFTSPALLIKVKTKFLEAASFELADKPNSNGFQVGDFVEINQEAYTHCSLVAKRTFQKVKVKPGVKYMIGFISDDFKNVRLKEHMNFLFPIRYINKWEGKFRFDPSQDEEDSLQATAALFSQLFGQKFKPVGQYAEPGIPSLTKAQIQELMKPDIQFNIELDGVLY